MKQKALKKSLAVLLVGMMLISQSTFADNTQAEIPDVQEALTEEIPAPDVNTGMSENIPADDAGEEVIQNAPIVHEDIVEGTGSQAPVPEGDTADEESYEDIKAKKEWLAKWAKDEPELVGAGDVEDEDAPWNGGEATELALNNTYEVINIEERATVWFKFVPEVTGSYKFYSYDREGGDPYGYLYDEEGDLITEDDDSSTGEDLNFAIRCSLTAGETYYFAATAWSGSEAVYSVSIDQVATVVDFTPTPIEGAHLIKESPACGDWYDDGEEEYFEYYDTSIQELFTIKYTLSDGTTGEWTYAPRSGYYVVADSEVQIEFDSAAAVIGTNTAVMVIDGIEKTIQFEMIELPDLETITVEKNPNAKAMLIGWENYGYWVDEDTEDEYFAFSWNFLMSQFMIHAEYKDGSIVDWQYDSDKENDYLDEKYPIEVYYTVYEDSVVLDIIVGEFEESIELDVVTFGEVSSGTITDTRDFSMSGDDFIVYTFVPTSSGHYDVTVTSDYGTGIKAFDSSGHGFDFEDLFYYKDGNTYTFNLTEGQTYYLAVDSYSERDHVTGTLSIKKHVSVRSFTAINDGFVPTIGSEVQGSYVQDDPTTFLFDTVYIAKAFTIYLTYDDGTTDVWRFDDDKSLSVRNNPIEFEQVTDPPYVTEDGVAKIKIGNLLPQIVDFVVSRTIPTVTSLTVTQVHPLYMGFDAYWRNGKGNSKYVSPYYKQLFSSLEITATYEDGTVFKRTYGENEPEVFYDETMTTDFDDIYRVSLERVNPESWTIGDANVLKATVGGKTASTKTTVKDMLSGVAAYEVPSTEVTKSRTPFTVDRQNRNMYACILKAPAAGEYSVSVLPEDENSEVYWGLYTTDGHMLADKEEKGGIITSEPVSASLEKGKTYIVLCHYFSDGGDSPEATLCIGLPENAAWPTPTPTPTPSPTPTPTGRKLFDDVKDPKHPYFKAIYWAADNNITKGYTGTNLFGIDDPCTRSQAMMFLWRIAGQPAPKSQAKSPFSDIKPSHPHYKAVLWAYQKGIAKGYPNGTYGVDIPCTRGQIATFIWRYKGSPAPKTTKSPFKDKITNAYFKAVLWAAEKGITKGYSDKTFRDTEKCTRGQIVTFLYRLDNLK